MVEGDNLRAGFDKCRVIHGSRYGYSAFTGTKRRPSTALFTYANHFAEEHVRSGPVLRVRHWHCPSGSDTPECRFDSHPGPDGAVAVVIVPASQIAPMPPGTSGPIAECIREHYRQGAVVAGVCGGVFLLAESGLLAGRRATTHWMFADELSRRFPDICVHSDSLVIDEGDIVTAGGVLSWANLGLSLVGRLLGPSIMTATARFILADSIGKEQRFYSSFSPRLRHGDQTILDIQRRLQTQAERSITIGERTFLRRFVKATGIKPIEYHQRLRVMRSQQMLESSNDGLDQIATAFGYKDPGSFRRMFKRIVGLSPSEYRRRFSPLINL